MPRQFPKRTNPTLLACESHAQLRFSAGTTNTGWPILEFFATVDPPKAFRLEPLSGCTIAAVFDIPVNAIAKHVPR